MAAALQRKKALWERQKSNALKEHQAKLAQFEKQRAARQQIEAEKRALIVQLSAELKETVTALETVSNSETKRTLVAKAKGLCKRLEELRKSAQCPTKRGDEAKQQNAVKQLLPDSVAAERLEKIAEVRQQLTELESRLQIEGSVESQVELRRKIADLKRKVRICACTCCFYYKYRLPTFVYPQASGFGDYSAKRSGCFQRRHEPFYSGSDEAGQTASSTLCHRPQHLRRGRLSAGSCCKFVICF